MKTAIINGITDAEKIKIRACLSNHHSKLRLIGCSRHASLKRMIDVFCEKDEISVEFLWRIQLTQPESFLMLMQVMDLKNINVFQLETLLFEKFHGNTSSLINHVLNSAECRRCHQFHDPGLISEEIIRYEKSQEYFAKLFGTLRGVKRNDPRWQLAAFEKSKTPLVMRLDQYVLNRLIVTMNSDAAAIIL